MRALTVLGLALVAAAFAYHVSFHPMDFRVYHYGARGVFDGTRPVYGVTSGLGWPMHYRYPPLFLLLFAPLAMLPLGAAAAIWVIAKIAILVLLIRAIWRRTPMSLRASPSQYAVATLFITPYLIEDFRYGNAQFFVLALTVAALMCLREKPTLGAMSLGLAIGIKVWPLLFLPYLAIRREWKFVTATLIAVIVVTLLPSVYFGFSGNLNLLGQWVSQESQTQLGGSEVWFPSQSLRGVLMRYLTIIDYSQVPDSNYPLVNIATIDPAIVRWLWMGLAGATYAGFLYLESRRRTSDAWLDHAFAFCLVVLLQPFTQKYALSVLLWPALAAAGVMQKASPRILIYVATALVLIQPLAPGAPTQRLFQVLGLDFFATVLLATALWIAFPRIQDSVKAL